MQWISKYYSQQFLASSHLNPPERNLIPNRQTEY